MREKDVAIWEKAKAYLDVRSNDEHTLYSYFLARQLLKHEEDTDPDVVLPAVILHDTGWKKIPKDKILFAFGPDKKYPELQRQHELESVEIASEILSSLGYDSSLISQVTEIIDGHDTNLEQRSINDAVMKDADKLWRFTSHGIRIISGWFDKSKEEFLEILESYVRPTILRSNSLLVADSLLSISRLDDQVRDYVEKTHSLN